MDFMIMNLQSIATKFNLTKSRAQQPSTGTPMVIFHLSQLQGQCL